MNFEDLLQQIIASVSGDFLNFLAALLILVGGWLLALIVAALVRRGLRRTDLDERLAQAITGEEDGGRLDLEKWIARIVFWVILIFAIVGFLQKVNLTAVAGPLEGILNQVTTFIPSLISALVLLLVAWAIASFIKFLIIRLAKQFKLDEKLTKTAELDDEESVSISETLATAAYWLIFLFFLPGILSALKLEGLVAPVQDMVGTMLAAVPNFFGAVLILLIGWFIARILRQVVSNLLKVAGADTLGARIGLTGAQSLSKLIGTIVYALVLISTITAALGELGIEAISGPATSMLNAVMEAVPAIFGAVLLLALAYMVARLVGNLVASLLAGVGFNALPEKLGLKTQAAEGQRTPAELVGYLVVVAVMLFATTEAANLLGFGILAEMIANFTAFGGQVLLALLIVAIGVYLANLARSVILSTGGEGATFTANLARTGILVFVGAMGLRQMGIADEIVNLAFGIMLGAIGVAAALAFGLGGKDIAAREVEKWLETMKTSSKEE